MPLKEICAVCNAEQASWTHLGEASKADCPRCGRYSLDDDARLDCQSSQPKFNRSHASGWVREHQDVRIDDDVLKLFMTLRAPSINERARKLLVAMYEAHPRPGESIDIPLNQKNPEWTAISWSSDKSEVLFLLKRILGERGLVIVPEPPYINQIVKNCLITADGHEAIESLSQSAVTSNIGFCAMWFSKSLVPVWLEAIQPAIRESGYEAIRIDDVEHVDKIDDKIIATIRRSKFVVADLTGSRGGVYFEAGFAMGLNIPVVWTVEADKRETDVHFDTRQYNCIGWSHGDLPAFRKALTNRIQAVLGRGEAALAKTRLRSVIATQI